MLHELGAGTLPRIIALNKADLPMADGIGGGIRISAKTGWGLDRLKEAIIGEIHRQRVRVTLTIPYQKGGLLSRIRANGTVLSEEYAEAGTDGDGHPAPGICQPRPGGAGRVGGIAFVPKKKSP